MTTRAFVGKGPSDRDPLNEPVNYFVDRHKRAVLFAGLAQLIPKPEGHGVPVGKLQCQSRIKSGEPENKDGPIIAIGPFLILK